MAKVMEIIAKATNGKSYNTEKYSLDRDSNAIFEYDDENNKVIKWQDRGETRKVNTAVDLREHAQTALLAKPVITHFLDGSRHVYKVDDIAYNHKVYPVMAGQVSVGCCKRTNGEMSLAKMYQRMVIALPKAANADLWDDDGYFASRLIKVNESKELKRLQLSFSKILSYEMPQNMHKGKAENSGVSAIQDYMIDSEKEMVVELVKEGKLNQNNYLIKDGSLEYKQIKKERYNKRDLQKIKNNYRYVIGVSKSFNPVSIKTHKNKTDAEYIINLPLFHRTPVAAYQNLTHLGDIKFGVWYLRIRDKKYTRTPFDGVLKIEKIMLDDEYDNGLDSDEVDLISANIINDRAPTCYGTDRRWANHLYPVYLTESYIKSRYLSEEMFLHLF